MSNRSTMAYMVVIRLPGKWWTFAKKGRDGQLFLSNPPSSPVRLPVVFMSRDEAKQAVTKATKQAWAKHRGATFTIVPCTVILEKGGSK